MKFTPIDFENWKRKEYYLHFLNEVPCTYAVSLNLDITNLNKKRLYPIMIWLLSQTVNEMQEFRMRLMDDVLGYYDKLHPCYTIFNKDNETFSGIWAYYDENYESFLKAYELDVKFILLQKNILQKPIPPSILFTFLWFPGSLLQVFRCILREVQRILRQFLQWERNLNKTAGFFCP